MSVPERIGNYRLEREIGRVASSEVWLGRHAHLKDHLVAVKLLMSPESEAVRRFGAGVQGTYGSLGVRRFRTDGAADSKKLGF